MNFFVVSFSSIFTVRELRRYRTLFRSRDLTKARNSIEYDKQNNVVNVLLYISMGPLSPNNRAVLRKEFSKRIPNGKAKLTLLPTSISQYFAYTSYLSSMRSLFKGSSFQLLISFPIPSNITDSDHIATYLKSEMNIIFSNIKKISFSSQDTNTSAINPIFVMVSTLNGAAIPRRFFDAKNYIESNVSYKAVLIDSVARIKAPSNALCANLQYLPKDIINTLSFTQKVILSRILFRIMIKKNAV